ncbi:unnamed protein product [Amoebophrya sp. A25]|nr:unnamed protein product [Amoebophrya sp. A25]|eukprot:GSA25T00005178001.1
MLTATVSKGAGSRTAPKQHLGLTAGPPAKVDLCNFGTSNRYASVYGSGGRDRYASKDSVAEFLFQEGSGLRGGPPSTPPHSKDTPDINRSTWDQLSRTASSERSPLNGKDYSSVTRQRDRLEKVFSFASSHSPAVLLSRTTSTQRTDQQTPRNLSRSFSTTTSHQHHVDSVGTSAGQDLQWLLDSTLCLDDGNQPQHYESSFGRVRKAAPSDRVWLFVDRSGVRCLSLEHCTADEELRAAALSSSLDMALGTRSRTAKPGYSSYADSALETKRMLMSGVAGFMPLPLRHMLQPESEGRGACVLRSRWFCDPSGLVLARLATRRQLGPQRSDVARLRAGAGFIPIYSGTETRLSVLLLCVFATLHSLQVVHWLYLLWVAYFISVGRLAPELVWRPYCVMRARCAAARRQQSGKQESESMDALSVTSSTRTASKRAITETIASGSRSFSSLYAVCVFAYLVLIATSAVYYVQFGVPATGLSESLASLISSPSATTSRSTSTSSNSRFDRRDRTNVVGSGTGKHFGGARRGALPTHIIPEEDDDESAGVLASEAERIDQAACAMDYSEAMARLGEGQKGAERERRSRGAHVGGGERGSEPRRRTSELQDATSVLDGIDEPRRGVDNQEVESPRNVGKKVRFNDAVAARQRDALDAHAHLAALMAENEQILAETARDVKKPGSENGIDASAGSGIKVVDHDDSIVGSSAAEYLSRGILKTDSNADQRKEGSSSSLKIIENESTAKSTDPAVKAGTQNFDRDSIADKYFGENISAEQRADENKLTPSETDFRSSKSASEAAQSQTSTAGKAQGHGYNRHPRHRYYGAGGRPVYYPHNDRIEGNPWLLLGLCIGIGYAVHQGWIFRQDDEMANQ